jgi:hypothetical protein
MEKARVNKRCRPGDGGADVIQFGLHVDVGQFASDYRIQRAPDQLGLGRLIYFWPNTLQTQEDGQRPGEGNDILNRPFQVMAPLMTVPAATALAHA